MMLHRMSIVTRIRKQDRVSSIERNSTLKTYLSGYKANA